jgi:hypothetical protein
LKERKSSEELRDHLSIECVSDVVRRGRLRWFGHAEWRGEDDCTKACQRIMVKGPEVGVESRGESLLKDIRVLSLKRMHKTR